MTLKTLTAVKTRLWNRWDLSTFPRLTALEVSFAGKTALEQLHRKVRGGERGEGVAAKLGCADISVLMVGGVAGVLTTLSVVIVAVAGGFRRYF